MEKRIYNQPLIEVISFNANTILAGSLEVNTGKTGEQKAKSFDLFLDEEDDNEEDY